MAVTYEPIASTTLGANATTVTFDSIPGTYTDLILVIHEPTASGSNAGTIKFNQDSGSNYSRTTLRGNGSAASSTRASSETEGYYGGVVDGAIQMFHIMSYANTNVFKTVLQVTRGLVSSVDSVGRQVTLWRSTNAITRIDLGQATNGHKSGFTFSLYGVKAA